MAVKLMAVRTYLLPFCLLAQAVFSVGQPAGGDPDAASGAQAQAVVQRALANELQAAQDTSHPMRYQLRKSSPQLTSTKEIFETRDGAVARLVSINDKPLNQTEAQEEQERLDALLRDPTRQQRRKQGQDADSMRALKVLRLLPGAFLYSYAGSTAGPDGEIDKFSFVPNPKFDPPDLETRVLTVMSGELWVDAAQERVMRLEGHLQENVDFGWGILGRLYKGGWIAIEQADVGENQWRVVHFEMKMSGRVLFRSKRFDVVEEQTQYAPLPVGLSYKEAIRMMREGPAATVQTGRRGTRASMTKRPRPRE